MSEKVPQKKCRDWTFTLNNYTDLEYTAILEIECRYLVVAKEVGAQGTPHLQGYIYFDNPRSFSGVCKLFFTRAHVECALGSADENRTYIIGPYNKNGKFKPYNPLHKEIGEVPTQGKRSDIQVVRDLIKEGQGMRQIVEVATSYQSIKTAEIILKYTEVKRDWLPTVFWICGKSGTGKTRYAYDKYPHDQIHKQPAGESKWFDGYDAHPVVILDEVDDSVSYSMLKELTDRHPCRVQVKGGSRQFLAKVIVITSLYRPELLFASYPENGYEMLRRITEIICLSDI